MAVFSKIILTGSTNGRGIAVAASGVLTVSNGTLVHTAVTGTGTEIDEITLYGSNLTTSPAILAILFGVSGVTGNRMMHTVPAHQTALVVPGLPLRNAETVQAKATSATGVFNVFGWVNRIT